MPRIRTHTSSNRTPLDEGYVYFSPSIGDFLVFFPHIDPEPHRRTLHICQLPTCMPEPGRACCGDNWAFGVGVVESTVTKANIVQW